MKEKDYEDNELIRTNSNISVLEKSNIIDLPFEIQKDKELYNIEEKKYLNLSNIKLEEIELGSKILCPEQNCFSNAIINIDPIFFDVNYDCGKHRNKMDIIEYVMNSGKSKEDKEKCFKCEETYNNLKKENKKLYKCYCEKNYCEKCKEEHLKENGENKNDHNMVDYKLKDYICCCNNRGKKYIEFCLICKKNLCIGCSSKDINNNNHQKIKFGELFQLTPQKKQLFKEKVEEQKKKIVKFNEIINNWFSKSKEIINLYKKKLELYNEINELIVKQYDSRKNYYEAIKNIEYMRLDFDDNFNRLIDIENNYILQNSVILKLLNENVENNKFPIEKNKKILNNFNYICLILFYEFKR